MNHVAEMDLHSLSAILFSIVCFGLWGYLGIIGIEKMGRYQYLSIAYIVTALIILGVSIFKERSMDFSNNIYIPILGGILTAVAVLSFFSAAERVPLSLLSPLVALYPAITIILSIVTLGEKLNTIQLFGVILALTAGVILGYSPSR
jgi:uncharacterized membrane protein